MPDLLRAVRELATVRASVRIVILEMEAMNSTGPLSRVAHSWASMLRRAIGDPPRSES